MAVKQVIVIRTDLNMRKGKMAAQAAHASRAFLKAHCLHRLPLSKSELEWLEGSHDTICVGVGSEDELEAIYERASLEGIAAYLITDLGKTEFHGQETKTCAAIGPDECERINSITGHLKLL